MKKVLLVVAFFTCLGVYAQQNVTLKGTVVDLESYNEPMLLADVQLKNTDWKAQTNFKGNFELSGVAPGTYTLRVSYLGYETREMVLEVTGDAIARLHIGMQAETLDMGSIFETVEETPVKETVTAERENR